MSVVYIRDAFVFKNIASYNVSTNIWFRDSSLTSNVNICGFYTTLLGNKACGIVRPKFAGFETHKDRFFIGDNIYFLDNTSLDSSVEYHENEKATFILRQNGEVVEKCIYSRKPNYPIPTFGIPQTEQENDMYYSIHTCIQKLYKLK